LTDIGFANLVSAVRYCCTGNYYLMSWTIQCE